MISILAFVLVVGSFIYFLIFPMVDKIRTNSNILEEDRIILGNLEYANKTGTLTSKEKEIQGEILEIEKILPTQVRIPEIFLEVLKTSNDIGIQQDSFTLQNTIIEEGVSPRPPQGEEGSTANDQEIINEKLLVLPVHHVVKGTYPQLKEYIFRIQNSDRRIDIVEYQFSSNNEDNIISANFLLHSYALVKDGQNYSEFVDYDFITGSYGKENPFVTSGNTNKEGDLETTQENTEE